MRILILGATGPTGRVLLAQALQRGHDVTAFVRSPDKLGVSDPRLQVVSGNFSQTAALRGAISGREAVLSALGTRVRGPTKELSDAAREVIAAMQAEGLRRLIWMSAMGVGSTRAQMGPIFSHIIPRVLRHAWDDKIRQEAMIQASGLDWTIVHPPMLTNGKVTGDYRKGREAATGGGLLPKIARADAAHFMLDALERSTHVREIAPIRY